MVKNNTWMNTKNIVALLVGAGVLYFLTTTLIDTRFRELELSTRVNISDQETLLTVIAETTARNGADAVTESIVKDCTREERKQFDELLGSLNTNLRQVQLVELERLFGRCGTFFSNRKSVMVTRFSREIEIYAAYVQQLSLILQSEKAEEFKVGTWMSLAEAEQDQSRLFSTMVALQDDIITELLAGRTATSKEMIDILSEVSEVQQSMLFANQQAATLRAELISI